MSLRHSAVSILFKYDVSSSDRLAQSITFTAEGEPWMSRPFVLLGGGESRPDLFSGTTGSVTIERDVQEPYAERLDESGGWFKFLGSLARRGELESVLSRIYDGEEFMRAVAGAMHQVIHLASSQDGKLAFDIWAMVPGEEHGFAPGTLLMSDSRIHDDRFEDGREEPPYLVASRFMDGKFVESVPMVIGSWYADEEDVDLQGRLRSMSAGVLLRDERLPDHVHAIEEALGTTGHMNAPR